MTVESMGWGLLHALWQGGLVAAALGVALLTTRRARPAVRYALAVGALALMVVLPVATVVATRLPAPSIPAPAAPVLRAPVPAVIAEAPRASEGARDAAPETIAATTPLAPPARVSVPLPAAWRDATLAVRSRVDPALPWLVGAWAAGLLLLSARLAGGVVRARRLAREETRPVDDAVRATAARVAARLRVRGAVPVLESARARAPMVVGFARPVILLPASALGTLAPAQLEMLLAHELAHVRRRDVLANLAQTVVETLLFFHPAAWWVSGRVREERENCCDDVALGVCGGDALVYSEVLLSLEEAHGAGPALAAAANEGALLRRIARLVGRAPAHVDIGPRWLAGVLTVGFGLVAASEAVGVAPRPGALSPEDVVAESAVQPPRARERERARERDLARQPSARDSAAWRPAAVLRVADGAPLASRWRAAEEQASARALRSYWVGYVLPGTGDEREWFYMDRVTPVRLGGSTFSGRMHFDGGNAASLRFEGVPLAPLLGEHPPVATTVFLRFDRGRGEPSLGVVHVSRYSTPMNFRALPVLWLGAVDDAESVARLGRMMSAERDLEAREDLVATVGMHVGSRAATESLIAWMEDGRLDGSLRREAASWLGRQRDRRAFAALARAARRSDDPRVRVEAVESMEHLPFEEAADTLMLFARTLPERAQRHEAIEALGHRTELRVVDFLHRLVDGAGDPDVASRAIEALGEMEGGIGADAVIDLARHHDDARIRKAAVEAVAQLEETRHALDVLRDVAWTDSDSEVRVEAIEAMADVHDDRVVALLTDVVERHADVRAQVEATEALANTVAPDAAIRALGRIARSHPRSAVQRKAAEALGDFDDARAVELLVALAESHADVDVQREATEALGSVHPQAPAIAALRRIARSHPSAEVRRRALESLADYAEDRR